MCICRQAVIRHSQLCWRDDNRFLSLSRNDIFSSLLLATRSIAAAAAAASARGATIWRPSTGYFSVHVAKLLGEGRKEEEEAWAYSIEAIVAQGGCWLLTSD
jgi:hypothetical protein